MIEPERLSAFIASRICHDLVSPISSVTNAVDFMNEPPESEMRQHADGLLKDGSEKAAARVEFLRYAFGTMGLSDGTCDMHEAKRIAERFVASHKCTIEWDIETDHLSFSHARLMKNMLMVGIECLPRAGLLAVRVRNEPAGMTITVHARGERARLQPDTALPLSGQVPESGWSARTIQPLFARMIAQGLGAELTAKLNGEDVVILAHGARAEG